MPRSVAWRRTYSDVANASQMLAASATIYILRQTGPFGFLLKEENESKNFKVYLGDPHSCTCAAFSKEKDLCKHICWVLMKKFRLNKDDPLSWQLGLSDHELDEVMRGPEVARRMQQQQQTAVSQQLADTNGGRSFVAQREISNDDICPICQDEFMKKKLPVTYCKFGCGNNIHIKCMKVWAEHQLNTSQDRVIQCPMCREDFGPINLLKLEMRNADSIGLSATPSSALQNSNRMDRHLGICCNSCRTMPIEGKCYRCCTCTDFYLCQACFNTPAHTDHLFQFRHKRNQRWREAQRTLGAVLPATFMDDLMNRELSPSDYETLLELDSVLSATDQLSDLTEETIQKLPMERVRERGVLLALGAQCRVCLRPFLVGQYVRKLPCQHKFHKDCIDGWLLHSRPTCPIDSSPVFTTRPHSDTVHREAGNRMGLMSTSSHRGSGDSFSGSRVLHNNVRSQSFPVPDVVSVRVGSGWQEGMADRRGSFLRNQARGPHVPHRPPSRLELTGTRFGVNGSANRRARESNMLVPGGRLLQENLERHSQISQHLTQLQAETMSGSLTEQREDQGAHNDHTAFGGHQDRGADHILFPFDNPGHQLASSGGPSSLANRGRQRTQPATSLRTAATLRQRSDSHGQLAAPDMQDLYLGNDPRLNPPPLGEVTTALLNAPGRARIGFRRALDQRPTAMGSRKAPREGRGRGSGEGSQSDML